MADFIFSNVVYIQPATLLESDLVLGISQGLCLFSRNTYFNELYAYSPGTHILRDCSQSLHMSHAILVAG